MDIQWSDAERAIASIVDTLTRKRSELHEYEHKFKRLIDWFEHFLHHEMNSRIDGLTLDASLDVLKNEMRNLLADKRRNVNELVIAARVLHTHSTDQIQFQKIKQQMDQLEQIMNTTEEHVEKRLVENLRRTSIECFSFELESRRRK